MSCPPFAERFAVARAAFGPLVFGLDPSAAVLEAWGLADNADGLESFVDLALEAAVGSVGMVKPQSAFYERLGWKGVRALGRLIASARDGGLLVILDAKRGDVGSTNDAYADAYLGTGAAMPVDALTVSPYLGVGALGAFFDAAVGAGSALFVVARSSNPEGRSLQEAAQDDGRTVEQSVLCLLGAKNRRIAPDKVGPFGAVVAPTHPVVAPTHRSSEACELDLAGMGGLFLAPGVGAQGAGPAEVAQCFAACPERVLPSASRALLAAGPLIGDLRGAMRALNAALVEALGAVAGLRKGSSGQLEHLDNQ